MNNMSDDDDNSCVSDTSSSVELDEDNEDAETSTHGQSSAETIKEVRDVTQVSMPSGRIYKNLLNKTN